MLQPPLTVSRLILSHFLWASYISGAFNLILSLTLFIFIFLIGALFIITVFLLLWPGVCVDIPEKQQKLIWKTTEIELLHRPKALKEANVFSKIWEDPQLQLSSSGDEAEKEEDISEDYEDILEDQTDLFVDQEDISKNQDDTSEDQADISEKKEEIWMRKRWLT